jgi:apolipoprotein N-acyltransferase
MLNWILEVLPSWVPSAIVIVGIVLFLGAHFLSFVIPSVYKMIAVPAIQIIAVVLFSCGFYLNGRLGVLEEAKLEIARISNQQQTANQQIQNDLQKKLTEVKTKNGQIIKYVTTKDNGSCVIPDSFIGLLNYATTNTVPKGSVGVNGTSTNIKTNSR